MLEIPLALSIGEQAVTNLAIYGGGTRMSGLIEAMPRQGDRIVLHFPRLPTMKGSCRRVV